MKKIIDFPRTRRRVEDALRKTADDNLLIEIAKLLHTEIAYFSFDLDIPKLEKQLANLLVENPAVATFKPLWNLLPARFTVYCVCIRGERRTRYYFTKEAAEAHIQGANYYVKAGALNLIDMRELVKTTELEWSSYELAPEEKMVFKELKSII